MSKRILFVIQGEGRGHMTQALALKVIIESAGYELAGVIAGTSSRRKLPQFFLDKIGTPVTELPSPNFVTDKKSKAVRILPSIFSTLRNLPRYIRSLRRMHSEISGKKPDLIINFYEPLLGFYYTLFRPAIPTICMGHQFLLQHPDFQLPKGFWQDKVGLQAFTRLVSAGSRRKLALSFYPFPNDMARNIYIVPPLLREAVYHQTVQTGNYILVYLLNAGYSEELIRWHLQNPEIELHCFTDRDDIGNR